MGIIKRNVEKQPGDKDKPLKGADVIEDLKSRVMPEKPDPDPLGPSDS